MAISKVVYKSSPSATPVVWMDTTQKTVTSASMLNGTTALKNDGTDITGNIQSQAAQTIHPSTSDQTIASGKYLSGTQTVKGVLLTNLTAGNIKKDVVVKIGDSTDDDCVTSVTGTYEGGASSGADISTISLLDGVTFNQGYITDTGGIGAWNSTYKQMYSDEVYVGDLVGEKLWFLWAFPQSVSMWFAIATYNSSHTFQTRTVYQSNLCLCPGVFEFTVPSGIDYIRVTFRSFGGIACALLKQWDAYDFLDDANATVITG